MKRIATRAVPVIAVLGFLAGKAAAVIVSFSPVQGAVVPQLVINYTPVPEASSAALVLATLGLAVRRRRHV